MYFPGMRRNLPDVIPRLVQRLLVFSSLLCPTLAFAAEQLSIGGSVTDSKGIAIVGASGRVFSGASKLAETLTDLDGSFKLEALPAGGYQFAIEIVGFLRASKDSVVASAESSRNLAIRLEPLPCFPQSKVPSPAPKRQEAQAPETPAFQSAQFRDLPGLKQFQVDLTQETENARAVASRQESLLFISGNSANLDGGDLNDPGFRLQMVDAARQIGFQIQDIGPGNPGGAGMGGFGAPGGMGPPGGGEFGGMGGPRGMQDIGERRGESTVAISLPLRNLKKGTNTLQIHVRDAIADINQFQCVPIAIQ
jgi:hypothetical protein